LETESTPLGIPIPTPYPQKIGKPRESPDQARARARILLDRLRRGEYIGPLPDINPNVPPPRPRPPIRTAPPPEMLPIPSPQIPAPGPVRQPAPAPIPSPRAPSIPLPQPGRVPPRPGPNRPTRVPRMPRRVTNWPVRVAQSLGAASILRPILRREKQSTSLLSRFTAPFDPVLNPIGETIAPPPATAAPPQVAEPITTPLTPANAIALSLNPQATGTRRKTKEDECNCEEEKEARRRPSSKVATVKTYRRRMSQNSLDNLRD
jgi:hypothetical protein